MSTVKFYRILQVLGALILAGAIAQFGFNFNAYTEGEAATGNGLKIAAVSTLMTERGSSDPSADSAIPVDSAYAAQIFARTDWQAQSLPITKGWTPKVLWVRMEIENTNSADRDVWIEVAPSRLTWIRLHQSGDALAGLVQTSGVSVAAQDRPIQLSDIVFSVRLKANEKRVVVLEAQSNTTALDLTLKLHQPIDFVEMSARRNLTELMIIGGTLALGLISLITGVVLRQPLQLLLGLRSLLIGVWLLGQLGVLALFFSSKTMATLAYGVSWAAVFTFVLTLSFVWLFLTRAADFKLPKFVHAGFILLSVASFLAFLLMLVGIIAPYQMALPFGLLSTILLMFTIPLSSWLVWKGRLSAITILVTSTTSLLINSQAYLSLMGTQGREVIRHFISPLPVLITTAVFFVGAVIQLARERKERQMAEQKLQQDAMQKLEGLVYDRTLDMQVARDEAVQANAAKTVFMAKVSHELRTPMHSVLGYVNLALREKLAEPVERKLRVARRAGEQLVAQISDLLDYARMGSDQIRLAPAAFSLPVLFESLKERGQLLTDLRGNHWVCQRDSNLPTWLWGDDIRLEQVVMVLINNAMRYTHEGSVTLDIQAAAVQPSSGCAVCFSVSDTGRGMSPEVVARIFKLFDRGDSMDGDGLGLGLPIAQQLLSLMGSQLEITSEPGKGSCFTFQLQFALPDEAQILAVQPAPLARGQAVRYEGRKRSILLLEDNSASLQYLKDLLAPLGFEAVAAGDTAAALLAVQAHAAQEFDLYLIDQHLSEGQTSWGFVKHLQEQKKEVPVLMLSATHPQPPAGWPLSDRVYLKQGEQTSYLAQGIAMHLLKPVREAALIDALAKLMHLQWSASGSESEQPDMAQVASQEAPKAVAKEMASSLRTEDWAQLHSHAKAAMVTSLIQWRAKHAASLSAHPVLLPMMDSLRFASIAQYAQSMQSS